jgi:CRP/FNR family transcriptional regulator, cyclic AMP receptor protein
VEAASSFWSLLGPAEHQSLEGIAMRRSYPRRSVVYHRGDDTESVIVLIDGRVKVCAPGNDGHTAVLGFRGPGDLVGELGAIDGRARSASVETLEAVTALVCPRRDFRALVDSSPAMAGALQEVVVDRLRHADAERADFGSHDVLGRVARRLCELADRFGEESGDGIEITLPLTQEELASWCGASREAVSKALTQMRTLGWIETRRRVVVITDVARLRTYAA